MKGKTYHQSLTEDALECLCYHRVELILTDTKQHLEFCQGNWFGKVRQGFKD